MTSEGGIHGSMHIVIKVTDFKVFCESVRVQIINTTLTIILHDGKWGFFRAPCAAVKYVVQISYNIHIGGLYVGKVQIGLLDSQNERQRLSN
jgi:hypothetical protein